MDIKSLISNGEEIEFKGEKISIKPLTVEELGQFSSLLAKENFGEASTFMFVATLRKAFPNWTKEEILQINDKEFINSVTSAMLRVNGIETKKKSDPTPQ